MPLPCSCCSTCVSDIAVDSALLTSLLLLRAVTTHPSFGQRRALAGGASRSVARVLYLWVSGTRSAMYQGACDVGMSASPTSILVCVSNTLQVPQCDSEHFSINKESEHPNWLADRGLSHQIIRGCRNSAESWNVGLSTATELMLSDLHPCRSPTELKRTRARHSPGVPGGTPDSLAVARTDVVSRDSTAATKIAADGNVYPCICARVDAAAASPAARCMARMSVRVSARLRIPRPSACTPRLRSAWSRSPRRRPGPVPPPASRRRPV